jgi:hypothetical protein
VDPVEAEAEGETEVMITNWWVREKVVSVPHSPLGEHMSSLMPIGQHS